MPPTTFSTPVLRAGVAAVDITGPLGAPLSGTCTLVKARRVIDRIRAKALVLEQGRQRIAIVTADVIAFEAGMVKRLSRALARAHGITTLLCNASHTHTAPDTYHEFSTFTDRSELTKRVRFHRFFERRIHAAVAAAAKKLQPVIVHYGTGKAHFGVQRRRNVGGSFLHMPNPRGYHDKTVSVFRFARPDGQPLAVLFSYACHPTTRYAPGISADFPGPAQRLIERRTGAVALFAQGAAGEIRPHVVQPRSDPPRFTNGTQRHVERFGGELGRQVLCVLRRPMKRIEPRLSVRRSTVSLRLDRPYSARFMRDFAPITLNTNPATYRALVRRILRLPVQRRVVMPLTLLRLSEDHAILATGHELCNAYLPALRRLARGVRLTVLSYTNAYAAYIPTRKMCHEGGYEPDWSCFYFGRSSPMRPSVERDLLAACARLIKR